MSAESRPFHVVVVSHQASLLHEVAWLLEAVGMRVQTSQDFEHDALWRRYSSSDFLLIDSDGVTEPTADTFAHNSENPIYRIFLYNPTKRTDFSDWFSAGAHDALRIPISRGELLSRLRAGARYLQFENRLLKQSTRSVVPNFYTRRGFLRKLSKLTEGDLASTSRHTLLATSVDWYEGIREINGRMAAQSLVNMAARAIKRATGENPISCYLGSGKFVSLLLGHSMTSAKAIAESLARDFSSRESRLESIPRPALTSAVAAYVSNSQNEDPLQHVLETLELAEQSGGGRVLQHGEFNSEKAAWTNDVLNGNPFASVVAQDIMESFPAIYSLDEYSTSDHENFDQPAHARLAEVNGHLCSLGIDHSVRETIQDISDTTSDWPKPSIETISWKATFPEIYETFAQRECESLIVTNQHGQPQGYITRDGFLSMIDPLDTSYCDSDDNISDELSYLAIPSS